MRPPASPSALLHHRIVQDDLQAGLRFIAQARSDLAQRARPGSQQAMHPAVPYPFALVMGMQRAHLASLGRPDELVDLATSTSIQYALTWNRVIHIVSGRLAAAYRGRAMRREAVLSRLLDTPSQTCYFAHRALIGSVALQGYWVSRDLHAGTDEPLLVIQPVVFDRVSGRRRRGRVSGFVAIPLREAWDTAVDAAAWENARAFGGLKAGALVQQFRQALLAWEPVVALTHDALTGRGGESCAQAVRQASSNDLGLRTVVLGLEDGQVAAMGV